jgi:outer membrane protein TolC
MRKDLPSAVLLLAPMVALAGEARPITMDEALRRAEELSPAGQEIALEIERARAEIAASGLWSNPEFSLVREESAGIVERFANVSQTFPLTGRLALERDAARTGQSAAQARAKQERIALRAKVRETFVDLLLAQELTKALETGRAQLHELVEVLRVREREGESSGFDRMRAERELAEVEADQAESRGRLAVAKSALAAVVALPADGLEASGSLGSQVPLPEGGEIQRLAAMRGDVTALDNEAERADLLARSSRRRIIPDLSLTAGTKTTEAGTPDDRGPVLGVGFSIPIFDHGQGGRAVAGAEGALLRTRRAKLVRLAETEIEAAYAEVDARRRAEEEYSAHGNAEDLLRIARATYEGGAMRILELLDAYRTVLAVRLRELELHAAARRAEAALGLALGVELPASEVPR